MRKVRQWAYFFERIELTLPIGSGWDRVNSAQVHWWGDPVKKTLRVTDPIGRVNSIRSKK